jgi:1-acyl-sn-glycerol-3-phosphate acyltransferase
LSSRRSTVLRRLRTVPLFLLLFVVTTLALPVLLAVAVVVDALRWLIRRRPWMATRLALFLWIYLAAEAWAIVALFLAWALPPRLRLVERTYRLQARWAALLFGAARRLFSLRFAVEGADAVAPGPIVVLMRHASIVDNLLPAVFVAAPHGLRLRYVLKRELLSDPAIDIAGGRLPNCFVIRGADDAEAEVARVRALAAGLGADEGVLIYPEGTRFTAAKRARAIERQPRAAELRHVLPPRPGGTLAVMETGADVIVCAHHGLDGFASIGDLWRGGLVRRTVSVRFSRFSGASLPEGREARTTWLWERWHEVDDWIGAQGTAA